MMPKQSMPIAEHRLPGAGHPGPKENMGIFTLSVGGPKRSYATQKSGRSKNGSFSSVYYLCPLHNVINGENKGPNDRRSKAPPCVLKAAFA